MPARLQRLRFPLSLSAGRRFPEPAHPYRNEFQRDRDRIVHARAFRRLENKTQVFTPALSDHFRDRLTHTIEVAQISRTLASTLGLDEDFTEALALAHDIGHPPFAHAGEAELDRQMRAFGDRFDHNLHALHIVETFEQRYARFQGLNLTFETREGIAKHSRDFEPGEIPELDGYLPGLRPPLEAQLIDPSDEIAYNTADLDDGFSAGMFSLDEIAACVPRYAAIRDEIRFQFPGASDRVLFQEALRRLIDWLVSGLVEGTLAAAEAAGVGTVEDIRRHTQRLAVLSAPARETNAALKLFLHRTVYNSGELVAERNRSAQRIARLFRRFLERPELLPEGYGERLAAEPAQRVVCDYVAGMTDRYFDRVYRQVFSLPN